MTMDDIVKRCSRFSGWHLRWCIKPGVRPVLEIWDPKDWGRSVLALCLVTPRGGLHEVYGRLRQWGISYEEYGVIERELVLAEAS